MPGADAAGTGIGLLVIGTNHRTSPIALRDRFALVEAEMSAALEGLRGAGLGELALIATCDRVELVTTSDAGDRTAALFVELLAERTGLAAATIAAGLHRRGGAAARARYPRRPRPLRGAAAGPGRDGRADRRPVSPRRPRPPRGVRPAGARRAGGATLHLQSAAAGGVGRRAGRGRHRYRLARQRARRADRAASSRRLEAPPATAHLCHRRGDPGRCRVGG